ncbi:MAG: cytochrome c [Ilumatobacteraceae bacterium]
MSGTDSRGRWSRRRIAAAVVAGVGATLGLGACSDDPAAELSGPAAVGAELAVSYNCTSCHSVDGSSGTGPTWKGIWGEQVELADGETVDVDDAYVRRSITDPSAQVVEGFSPIMPAFDLPDDELDALSAYLRSLGEDR